MEQYMERLANPDLIFGLAVRFFGVFVVLIIVMIGIWIVGQIFLRAKESAEKEKADQGQALSAKRETTAAVESTGTGEAGAEATEEVAAVIAVHLQESAETAGLRQAGSAASEDVAAVIALSLARHMAQQTFMLPSLMQDTASRMERESPWKIMGRQETFSTRTLPFRGRRATKGR